MSKTFQMTKDVKKCEDGCSIIINGEEYNCYTDRENGDCYIFDFNKDKYEKEMRELLKSDAWLDLLYIEIL